MTCKCGQPSAYYGRGGCKKCLVKRRMDLERQRHIRTVEWRARYKLKNDFTPKRKLVQL